jgi:endoglucanase
MRHRPSRLALSLALAAGVTATAGSTHAAAPGATNSSRTGASSTIPRQPAARATTYTNPLAGRPWGVYQGAQDLAWAPYVNATGTRKRLLGYIALTPKAKWFGAWIPNSDISQRVKDYIANAQAGDRRTLVQMTVFRMVPWEHEACSRLPSRAERASYKQWIDRFAAAVGTAHAAIWLQPDGPFALCAPGGSLVPSHLVAYAAEVLSAQPHTSVYVEAGAADWPHAGSQGGVDAAVRILVRGGIRYAHGFALNTTHFDSTADNVARAAAIARRLAALGYPHRHAVINTSTNGHPYQYGAYTGSDPNNPVVCGADAPASATCAALGIPPTSHVAASRWHLSDTTRRQARHHVDGYLWVGRPWLYRGAQPFVMKRALKLVRNTPWR